MSRVPDDVAEITVRVSPRASRTLVEGFVDNVLKVKLAAPPVDGAANNELIRLLAKTLKVSKSSVEISNGQRSRTKYVKIHGLSREVIQDRIESS